MIATCRICSPVYLGPSWRSKQAAEIDNLEAWVVEFVRTHPGVAVRGVVGSPDRRSSRKGTEAMVKHLLYHSRRLRSEHAEGLNAFGRGSAKLYVADEGTYCPDQDAQIRYIADRRSEWRATGDPVISVDSMSKKLSGNRADDERVAADAFVDRSPLGELATATIYGVYDVDTHRGWVSVGDSADTAEFAVASIRRWWNQMGQIRYPAVRRLLIIADGGGSNGSRVRAWKWHLAGLAAETGLEVTVCHYPPGSSEHNPIEYRLFNLLAEKLKGQALSDIRTIVKLIAATETTPGLNVQSVYDPTRYRTGQKISDTEMSQVALTPDDWHGHWNYTVHHLKHATSAPVTLRRA